MTNKTLGTGDDSGPGYNLLCEDLSDGAIKPVVLGDSVVREGQDSPPTTAGLRL